MSGNTHKCLDDVYECLDIIIKCYTFSMNVMLSHGKLPVFENVLHVL